MSFWRWPHARNGHLPADYVKNRSIKGNLTFTMPTPLILSLSILLLSINRSTISYNYLTVTSCELVSAMLVLLPNFNVVTAVISVVVSAFSGILFDFFYYNYSSNYITEPGRKYYSGFY